MREKDDLINEAEQIVVKINAVLGETYYLKPLGRIDHEIVESTHEWLIGANILADRLIAARKMVSEDMWKNYEMFGLKGLQEQEVFEKAKNNLQFYLKCDKPKHFRKGHADETIKNRENRYKKKPFRKPD